VRSIITRLDHWLDGFADGFQAIFIIPLFTVLGIVAEEKESLI
jgi:hypothetical protein